MVTLDRVGINKTVTVINFNDVDLQEKIAEMGCLVGDSITVLKIAPLGDPIMIQVDSSVIGLRKAEAMEILVETGSI